MVNGIIWHYINSKKVHSHCTTCSPLCSLSLSAHLTSDFPSMCSEVSSSSIFSALPLGPALVALHSVGGSMLLGLLPGTGMGLDKSLLRKLQIFSHLLGKEYF